VIVSVPLAASPVAGDTDNHDTSADAVHGGKFVVTFTDVSSPFAAADHDDFDNDTVPGIRAPWVTAIVAVAVPALTVTVPDRRPPVFSATVNTN
jgi:hypothetical protein